MRTVFAWIGIGCVAIIVLGVVALAFDLYGTEYQKVLVQTPSSLSGAEQGLLSQHTAFYQADDNTTANTTYIRYESSNSESVFIKKVTDTNNLVVVEKIVGLWTNRANLTYTPIND